MILLILLRLSFLKILRGKFEGNLASKFIKMGNLPKRLRTTALINIPYLSRWFERLTMTVILFNCVTLGMYQPCEDNECDNQRCRILKVCPYLRILQQFFRYIDDVITICSVGKIQTPIFLFFLKKVVNFAIFELGPVSYESPGKFTYCRGIL